MRLHEHLFLDWFGSKPKAEGKRNRNHSHVVTAALFTDLLSIYPGNA